jgi:hypothetical protein
MDEQVCNISNNLVNVHVKASSNPCDVIQVRSIGVHVGCAQLCSLGLPICSVLPVWTLLRDVGLCADRLRINSLKAKHTSHGSVRYYFLLI